MNLEEIKKDLNSKVNGNGYFNTKLFKKDYEYNRRSFDDLFKYYRRFKVTEKLLLQALFESNFSAKVCSAIKKVVFFKYYKHEDKSFWATSQGGYGYSENKETHNTKYTADYLDNLFKTIY